MAGTQIDMPDALEDCNMTWLDRIRYQIARAIAPPVTIIELPARRRPAPRHRKIWNGEGSGTEQLILSVIDEAARPLTSKEIIPLVARLCSDKYGISTTGRSAALILKSMTKRGLLEREGRPYRYLLKTATATTDHAAALDTGAVR